MAGWVGEMDSKAISASNLKLKLKLTEAELGKNPSTGSVSKMADKMALTLL